MRWVAGWDTQEGEEEERGGQPAAEQRSRAEAHGDARVLDAAPPAAHTQANYHQAHDDLIRVADSQRQRELLPHIGRRDRTSRISSSEEHEVGQRHQNALDHREQHECEEPPLQEAAAHATAVRTRCRGQLGGLKQLPADDAAGQQADNDASRQVGAAAAAAPGCWCRRGGTLFHCASASGLVTATSLLSSNLPKNYSSACYSTSYYSLGTCVAGVNSGHRRAPAIFLA